MGNGSKDSQEGYMRMFREKKEKWILCNCSIISNSKRGKASEQAMRRKTVSNTPQWPLLQLFPPGSCLEFLQ